MLGYLGGVPFFWTLRLLPAWVLYVGSAALALYFVDRHAYARESPAVRARCADVAFALGLRGKRNAVLLMAIGPAALLPVGLRELAMVAITTASVFVTPPSVRQNNGFSLAPMVEVAILFAGLFACLRPIQLALTQFGPSLPLHRSWQIFWAAGVCSTILANVPTYTAFATLARGQSGQGAGLVAGIAAVKLAAVSIGCVVMRATTHRQRSEYVDQSRRRARALSCTDLLPSCPLCDRGHAPGARSDDARPRAARALTVNACRDLCAMPVRELLAPNV
ncbi:MAG: sodium:proton antiporter [Myxococcota bacterium]|nr:sodium:proton antiporter [Myxococcota bacterium]